MCAVSWRDRLRDALGGTGGGERTTGRPPSSNGASSFHLGWALPAPATGVSVTLEVLEPPTVPALYFWAMQTDVGGASGRAGGAHLGLQWHPQHPGSTAVNWGGYRAGGGELEGSASTLRSATGNPNTRDLPWQSGRAYRLSVDVVQAAGIDTAPPGRTAWRGSVWDLATGDMVVVRDLYMAGDRIVGATMWSEVFARCDDPSVTVRWSEPVARIDGTDVPVERVSVNYQAHLDGGCANTNSSVDEVGVRQQTSIARTTPQGTQLRVPGA
jgi:hypothetical protein